MSGHKQFYLSYWKQLKLFINEQGIDWDFASFEPRGELTVRVGKPKFKIILSIMGCELKKPLPFIGASFYIHDYKEVFFLLRRKRESIEEEMGKALEWETHPARKHCSIRVKEGIDLTKEDNWPDSFVWFAQNVEKLRDVCYRFLSESKTEVDLKHITGYGLNKSNS